MRHGHLFYHVLLDCFSAMIQGISLEAYVRAFNTNVSLNEDLSHGKMHFSPQ